MVHGVVHLVGFFWIEEAFGFAPTFSQVSLGGELLWFVLAMVFTLILSEISYRLIEVKFSRFCKRLLKGSPIYS